MPTVRWDEQAFAAVLAGVQADGRIEAEHVHISATQLAHIVAAASTDPAFPARPTLGRANFRHARFEGTASFHDIRFDGDADFTGAQFLGPCDFREAEFRAHATFAGVWFHDDGDFSRASFRREADFRGIQFLTAANARFASVHFALDAIFNNARFDGSVHLTESEFLGPVHLERTRVIADAFFTGAAFRVPVTLGPMLVGHRLVFDRAIFEEDSQIQASTNELSCERARFVGRADLKLRWAEMVLDDALFQQRSWLTGSPSFPGLVEAPTTLELGRRADDRLLPAQERPRLLSLREANVGNLSMGNIDLRACRFAKAQGLDQVRFESDCQFAGRPGGWPFTQRRTLAEEHDWRSGAELDRRSRRRARWDRRRERLDAIRGRERSGTSHARSAARYQRRDERRARRNAGREQWHPPTSRPASWLADSDRATRTLDTHEIANLYRALRKALEDTKDEPGAGDLYYGEMEMRRRDSTHATGPQPSGWRAVRADQRLQRPFQETPDERSERRRRERSERRTESGRRRAARSRRRASRAERTIVTLYWLFSGYGLRASRALIALLVLVMLATVAFHLYGFRDRVNPYAKTVSTQQERIAFPPGPGHLGQLVDGLTSIEAWTYSVGTATAIVGAPDAQLTQTGRAVRIILRILSPVLIGLALLAIRGRVKR
jgi:uncharacterized protein YjbI with pentapeptide repeats